MIRPIVRDVFFLRQKPEPAAQGDLALDKDLRDTLEANRERCVGMAANMIGVKHREPWLRGHGDVQSGSTLKGHALRGGGLPFP